MEWWEAWARRKREGMQGAGTCRNVTLLTPSRVRSTASTRSATCSGVPNSSSELIFTGSTVIPACGSGRETNRQRHVLEPLNRGLRPGTRAAPKGSSGMSPVNSSPSHLHRLMRRRATHGDVSSPAWMMASKTLAQRASTKKRVPTTMTVLIWRHWQVAVVSPVSCGGGTWMSCVPDEAASTSEAAKARLGVSCNAPGSKKTALRTSCRLKALVRPARVWAVDERPWVEGASSIDRRTDLRNRGSRSS